MFERLTGQICRCVARQQDLADAVDEGTIRADLTSVETTDLPSSTAGLDGTRYTAPKREPEAAAPQPGLRRQFPTGSRAMSTALVLAEDGRRGDGRWKRGSLAAGNQEPLNTDWANKITQCGVILDFAPELADEVVAGDPPSPDCIHCNVR